MTDNKVTENDRAIALEILQKLDDYVTSRELESVADDISYQREEYEKRIKAIEQAGDEVNGIIWFQRI